MRVRHFAITGFAALLGGVAALFAVGNSRVPLAGLVSCPVLLVTVPVFDYLAELDDISLWAVTAAANAVIYALVSWVAIMFVRRRSRRRRPSAS